jgi:hypothetical protein
MKLSASRPLRMERTPKLTNFDFCPLFAWMSNFGDPLLPFISWVGQLFFVWPEFLNLANPTFQFELSPVERGILPIFLVPLVWGFVMYLGFWLWSWALWSNHWPSKSLSPSKHLSERLHLCCPQLSWSKGFSLPCLCQWASMQQPTLLSDLRSLSLQIHQRLHHERLLRSCRFEKGSHLHYVLELNFTSQELKSSPIIPEKESVAGTIFNPFFVAVAVD